MRPEASCVAPRRVPAWPAGSCTIVGQALMKILSLAEGLQMSASGCFVPAPGKAGRASSR